jgi:ABC-type multidrug transport system fused ATPase/permease subunit
MKKPDAVCPQCSARKEVYQVSEIYLSGLESIKSSKPLKNNTFDLVFGHPSQKLGRRFVDQTTKRTLVSKFSPPSSSKQRITRSLSPDFIMFATLLLSIFMLYQIFTQQRKVFLPALLIILGVTVGYFLTRKKIVTKFQQKQNTDAKETGQVKEAIQRWMKLYYCAQDFIVFDQKYRIPVPLQDMNLYVFSPEDYIAQHQPKE